MSTFCRITGKSRGLPKPNYFPLLPPISPADAKRFCKITGKSFGLPSHNYIPVSLVKNSRKRKCRITGNEAPHKFVPEVKRKRLKKKRHVFIAEYRYVSPVLEGVTEQQKLLLELLSTKDGRKISLPDTDSHFVYSVEEGNCILVFSSTMEAAVRDGEIRDIMLDRDSDTVVLKLNKGRNISVKLKEVVPKVDENSELFEGEGPSADVLKERKKQEEEAKKIKRTDGLKSVKKIFEEKERLAEMQVEKELEITEQKKAMVAEVMLKAEINNEIKLGEKELKDQETMTEEEEREMLNNWKRFDPRHSRAETSLFMCSGDWRDLLKPLVETWNWEEVENELSRSKGTPIITRLPSPTALKAEVVNLGEALPGIVQSKALGFFDDIGSLEPIPSVAPFTPLVAEPNEEVQKALKNLRDTEVLLKTANVKKLFIETSDLEAEKLKALLPKLREIPDLVSRLENGVVSEIEQNGEKLFGLVIEIEAANRFVVGQIVVTPNGSVFVPGETIETPIGLEFVPGFVIKTPGSESPVLIPGQKVMARTQDSGENPSAAFVAGQTLITRDGEKFVAGQTVSTSDGPKFMPGQTVITPDGPKFIPGQLIPSKTVIAKKVEEHSQDELEEQQNAQLTFVPGQSVMTSEGLKFVPGQTIITALGEGIFIAGQSVETEKGWEFVPGQSVKTDNGETKFMAGQTIMTNEGPTFIPGQVVHNDEGLPTFVPGVTIEGKDGTTKFVPGKTLQTSEGLKFVEGQIVKTATGSTTFVPGKTAFDANVKFSVASKLEDTVLNEVIHIPKEGLQPINPCSEVIRTQHASTLYGHVVQTVHGVEFFPGPLTSALPAGRILPGKLEQSAEGKVKFFPGKLLVGDNGIETFIPGQMVMTEKGEHFVPGQVVETSEGAKFVPGQVVESRTGPKFVPGQTMETPEGLRFVPGQIVETAVGPTFIPGQIISTEEGSKFVPGEVLETTEGPRFVPGRVIETGDNRVRFAPGEIVQTKEGQFHFVAPDLQDTPGGDFQFLVQGFEVTPEELQLLRPAYITPSYIPTTGGEMSIDSRMLRQLSEAGMSLGRQVSTDIPAVDVRPRHAMLNEVKSVLHKATDNKVEILKDLLQEQYTEESIMERLSVVLKNDAAYVSTEKVGNARQQALETAFLHLSRGNPEFMECVLQKLSQQVDILETENAATQALQRAIISVVHESSDQRVRAILNDVTVMDTGEENVWNTKNEGGLKTLILQSVGLARALGMSDVATGLLEVLNDPDTAKILSKDCMTMDILRRLTVMRQLAERNPNYYMALRQLQNDPESAKSDPRLRDLVRESAALMVVPEEDYMPLESSKDIPSTLLHSNNLLAMEEFLFSRNQQTTGTIMILKPGFQCVIPRENARGILTGQMAFTVLDENGIRHFEPLHVFSALHMPRLAAHHFSMYSCPVVREEETTYSTYTAATLTPGSSCDDLGILDSYTHPSETTTTRRRGTSDSIDGLALSYTRLNGMDDEDTLATSEYNTPRQDGRRCGTLDDQSYSVYTKCNGERSPTPPSGYDTPNARTMGSYTPSEENSPTYGKYGNTNGASTFGDTSTRTFGSEMFDVYAVNQSFNSDDGDSISLKKGDLVEVLNSGQESFKLRSRNSSYLLDKYKNLNSYIESGHGAAPHSRLKNPRSSSHSSGSAKSLTFDSSRLSGGVLLSREDMYGSRVLRDNLSPVDTRRTHEYSRAYASPRSYDAMKIHNALITDTYKLKLNDPSLPYSSPRCYEYLGSCGGSRIYDPLRPFNSRRFYESFEFTDPVEPLKVASPSRAYGYYESPSSRKITNYSSIHAAYSPNPYDPYAYYNAQPMSTYEPKSYEMSPERDIYNPVNIRKPTFRLSESPEPFKTQKLESKYRELSPEISLSRKLQQPPEPADISRPIITDYEPQFSSTMQRIHIRANILGGKKLNSGSK